MRLKIEGADELMAKMATMPARFERKLKLRVTDPTAKEVAASARSLAEEDEGNLRQSVRTVSVSSSPPVSEVVATDEAAPFQEFGTRYMEPNSFLRPAVRENEAAAQRRSELQGKRMVSEERE